MSIPRGEYPRNRTGSLTGRDFNVVYLSGDKSAKPIGYIQTVTFNHSRIVSPRYEIGLEEISYLSPAAISQNTLNITKFLYTGSPGGGGYGQTSPNIMRSILDYNTPVDIAIVRYAGDYPGQGTMNFLSFHECWFTSYAMTIQTDSGAFTPLVETATLAFTWMD